MQITQEFTATMDHRPAPTAAEMVDVHEEELGLELAEEWYGPSSPRRLELFEELAEFYVLNNYLDDHLEEFRNEFRCRLDAIRKDTRREFKAAVAEALRTYRDRLASDPTFRAQEQARIGPA